MALSTISTIAHLCEYSNNPETLTLIGFNNDKWNMGTNWGGVYYIRTKGGGTTITSASITIDSDNKALNVLTAPPIALQKLVGKYSFDSNLGGTGNLIQLFCGNTDGHSFTIQTGTWITLKFRNGLYMQPLNPYSWMASGSTATIGKSYMIQGSNDNGTTWEDLFSTNILLNSSNNGSQTITPISLTTKKYNMFKWVFTVSSTTTGLYNVDMIGKFYYDPSV